MEQKMALPRGARKHIRRQKARIRREFLDETQKQEQIKKLYKKFVVSVLDKQLQKAEQPVLKKRTRIKKPSA